MLGIIEGLTKDKDARVLFVNCIIFIIKDRLISLILPLLYNIKSDSMLEYVQITVLGIIFDVVTVFEFCNRLTMIN